MILTNQEYPLIPYIGSADIIKERTPPMYFRLFTKRKVEVIIKKVMFSVIITRGLGGIMAYFAHQTIKESPNS